LSDKENLATADQPNHPSQDEPCSITWQATKCENGKEGQHVVLCRPSLSGLPAHGAGWLCDARRPVPQPADVLFRMFAEGVCQQRL